MELKQNRIVAIDFTRGIAVTLMIIAHMGMFGIITANNVKNAKISKETAAIFDGIGTIAHTLFIILVGVNMTTSLNRLRAKHSEERAKREFIIKNIKRGAFIFLLGVLISSIVKIVFGEWLVFFGIFQFIAVAIVLAIPFTIYYNHITNILAIILILVISINSKNAVGGLGFLTGRVKYRFIDFFPIIPYFSYVLVGIMVGKFLEGVKFNDMKINSKQVKELVYTGQNSIQIYFIHLIVIFAIMKAILRNKKIEV
jgi:uncharacterized membrane protein